MQIVIVTGLSGAGKSTALRALEDIEFFCVDNIPMPLVAQMVEHLAHEGDRDKLAIAIDSRQRRNLAGWATALAKLRGGDRPAALDIYKRLADDLTAPQGLRARASEMVSALGEAASAPADAPAAKKDK